MDARILSIGIDFKHNQSFEINRPGGSGDFVFIHFPTPIRILTVDGIVEGAPGSCIFYTPPAAQWYQGTGNGFSNDWFHCDGTGIREAILHYGIPENRLFMPDCSRLIIRILTDLHAEHRSVLQYRENMQSLLIEELFIGLSRGLKRASGTLMGRRKSELYEEFNNLRFNVGNRFKDNWTVKRAAESVHLSESRFSVLYKEFFGISFIDDLLSIRLEHAAWLLMNTNMPVREAASESGFNNVFYFSRAFKKRYKCPPVQYYRKSLE